MNSSFIISRPGVRLDLVYILQGSAVAQWKSVSLKSLNQGVEG